MVDHKEAQRYKIKLLKLVTFSTHENCLLWMKNNLEKKFQNIFLFNKLT